MDPGASAAVRPTPGWLREPGAGRLRTLDEPRLYLFGDVAFVGKIFRLTSSDDLAVIRGDMSLPFTGGAADAAIQGNREEAVELAGSGKVDAMQRLERR